MGAVAELFWTGSYHGTTIDQICAKAGVRKGSFYHFFNDKAALAEAALEAEWQRYRPQLDALFSASVPPLERLQSYCEFCLQEQAALEAQHGSVLGCPLCTLGTEVSNQEKGLQRQIQEIMARGERYLETALRDAHAAGLLDAPDAPGLAKVIHAFHLGLLTQARIRNDLGVLRDMTASTFAILRLPPPAAAKARPSRRRLRPRPRRPRARGRKLRRPSRVRPERPLDLTV